MSDAAKKFDDLAMRSLDDACSRILDTRRGSRLSSDHWPLGGQWKVLRKELFQQIKSDTYNFTPAEAERLADGSWVDRWFAQGSIVLKVLTSCLQARLPLFALFDPGLQWPDCPQPVSVLCTKQRKPVPLMGVAICPWGRKSLC